MYKAMNYFSIRRNTAKIYLKDGHYSFSINLSEDAIRSFATSWNSAHKYFLCCGIEH